MSVCSSPWPARVKCLHYPASNLRILCANSLESSGSWWSCRLWVLQMIRIVWPLWTSSLIATWHCGVANATVKQRETPARVWRGSRWILAFGLVFSSHFFRSDSLNMNVIRITLCSADWVRSWKVWRSMDNHCMGTWRWTIDHPLTIYLSIIPTQWWFVGLLQLQRFSV